MFQSSKVSDDCFTLGGTLANGLGFPAGTSYGAQPEAGAFIFSLPGAATLEAGNSKSATRNQKTKVITDSLVRDTRASSNLAVS